MRTNNIILNRIFTRATFKSLLKEDLKNSYYNIIDLYLNEKNLKNNREAISEIYNLMKSGYRNEYYFKNTLVNKLLLGKYSLNTTTALAEIPVYKSKADFILINKKAMVYEIKTSLDNLERLEHQIKDYYKAFTYVAIVTYEGNYEKVRRKLKNTKVGIYILTEKNSLSLKKEMEEETRYLEYESIFKILRKEEFENILLRKYKRLPESKPVFYYDDCFELFKKLDMKICYEEFLKELKKRKNIDIKMYKEYVPYELRCLAYFSEYKKGEYLKLDEFLKKDIRG